MLARRREGRGLVHRARSTKPTDRGVKEAPRARPRREGLRAGGLARAPPGSGTATLRQAIAEAEAVGDRVAISAFHNLHGCVSLHTREGKAIVATLDAAAERGVRHDDPLEARGLTGRGSRDQRGDISTPRRASMRGCGGSARSRQHAVTALDGIVRMARGRTGRGAAAALADKTFEFMASEELSRNIAVGIQLAERRGDRNRVEALLRRLHDLAEAAPCEPVVEWTVLPIESALRAGIPTDSCACRCVLCSTPPVTCRGSVWGRPCCSPPRVITARAGPIRLGGRARGARAAGEPPRLVVAGRSAVSSRARSAPSRRCTGDRGAQAARALAGVPQGGGRRLLASGDPTRAGRR